VEYSSRNVHLQGENLVGDLRNVIPSRLMCLDVYRGLMVAGMIVVDNPGNDDHAYWPIMHTKWNGWTPADFIFPSFLFLVGISMVYSYFCVRCQSLTRPIARI
jgi:predicted acyltransferase